MIPALLTSTSSREWVCVNSRANRSMEARPARSSAISWSLESGNCSFRSSKARSPRSADRQARDGVGAVARQFASSLQSDATVGPGDHHHLAREVRDLFGAPLLSGRHLVLST